MRVKPSRPVAQALLVAGDVAVFLLFSVWGRASHGLSLGALEVLKTAFPFLAAWLVVGAALKAFRLEAFRTASGTVKRVTGIWLVAGVAGLVFRALLVGHAIIPSFAVVTLITVWVLMVVWRLVFWALVLRPVRR
ncbi:DUF3054 domain-containing protein [Calditerricola satsumensis]|uniref:DUF3054 domain-containing protein n=1 Tax=Calditerricola satsumensis TaxID=373054 RepID=A0A8J3BFW4_9BACI|nr:DUF3054 domain-containing protein [Calditerricola satsumensis]GGK00882.1 hypothetical protein GCM10007043_13640 [Calditerricola satsumensis]